jgi:hypothetical protein
VSPRERLAAKISDEQAAIQEIERRPGRRTGAQRAEIAERSRYLSGLTDAYEIAFGVATER